MKVSPRWPGGHTFSVIMCHFFTYSLQWLDSNVVAIKELWNERMAPRCSLATPCNNSCAAPAPGADHVTVGCGMVRRIVALQRVPDARDVRAAVPWLCHPPVRPQLPRADALAGEWV